MLTPHQAERDYFREVIHKAFGYETFEPVVDAFHRSQAKTKIISCPARTSKSYAGWKDVLPDIFHHGARAQLEPDCETQRIWIVAPNYDLAKEFDYAWEDLIERRETLGFDYEVVKATKSKVQGNMIIHLRWGKNAAGRDVDTIVEVKSAANEKTLQSEEIDIAILSEAARLPEIVWTKYLSTRVGRSVWPTTPDIQAAWIFHEIERGTQNPDLGVEHFQFTPRANPKFNYERYWVEHQKAEARVDPGAPLIKPHDARLTPHVENGHDCFDELTQCNAMKDLSFAEQFGGLWTFHKGRVVPIRVTEGKVGEPAHVIAFEPSWGQWADIHIAFDYGFTDPAVAGFWMVGPQQVHLRRSIYQTGLTPDVLVDMVRDVIKEMGWEGRITRMIGDPKKPEVVELFRRKGLPIWDQNKQAQADRKASHMLLMNYLDVNPATKEPFLTVHDSNVEIIDEWSTLRYNEKVRDPHAPSALIGARDDGYDMARYFVASGPPVNLGRDVQLKDTDFSKLRKSILKNQNRRHKPTVTRVRGALVGGFR